MIFVELQLRATWYGCALLSNRSTDVKHIAERLCVRVRIFLIPYSLAQNQNIPYSCPLKGLYSLFLILMWGPRIVSANYAAVLIARFDPQ